VGTSRRRRTLILATKKGREVKKGVRKEDCYAKKVFRERSFSRGTKALTAR